MRVYLISVVLLIDFGIGALGMRVKRQRDDLSFSGANGQSQSPDFLSNLGTQLNRMLGSFLGQSQSQNGQPQQIQNQPQSFQQSQLQPFQAPPIQQPQNFPLQQNSPVMIQPQIQQPPDQLPTLGPNSAYDRRVSKMNQNRKNRRPNPRQQPQPQSQFQPQPNFPQQPQNGPPPQERPVQIIDQNGKLSYCKDNPADCSYLSCLAENFQKSEQANNLKMAGKVFLDRNLRKAVMNDPLISQAACDKVGLDGQGCQGFKQLLGIVDQFAPGPTEEEMRRDPEMNGRKKRDKPRTIDYDYDHLDVHPSGRSDAHGNAGNNRGTNVGPNRGPSGAPSAGPNGNPNRGPSPQNGPRPTSGPNRGGNGNWNSRLPPPPNSFSTPKPNGNHGHHGGSIDYHEFYETGGTSSRGNGNGNRGRGPGSGFGPSNSGETARYQPRDCKAIARNGIARNGRG